MINNLAQIIAARDKQLGGKMLDEIKNQGQKEELVEILKLIFDYIRQSNTKIEKELEFIKEQQQKILNKFEDKNNINKDE